MKWALLVSVLLAGCDARATAVSPPAPQTTPEPRVEDSLASFAHAVQTYCHTLRCSVTSWGRTARHNRRVGGVEESHHLEWLAVDVVYDPPMPAREARGKLAAELGLVVLHYRTHDHLHPRGARGGEDAATS